MNSSTNFYIFVPMLLIAVLSGLGVGSGGLLVIFLTSFIGLAPTSARVTNLLFFILSSSGALISHSLKGRIKFKLVAFIAAFGILGTFIGTAAGKLIGDSVLKLIFGIMLVISGAITVFGKKIKEAFRNLLSARRRLQMHKGSSK